jgi:hypothetical protein
MHIRNGLRLLSSESHHCGATYQLSVNPSLRCLNNFCSAVGALRCQASRSSIGQLLNVTNVHCVRSNSTNYLPSSYMTYCYFACAPISSVGELSCSESSLLEDLFQTILRRPMNVYMYSYACSGFCISSGQRIGKSPFSSAY